MQVQTGCNEAYNKNIIKDYGSLVCVYNSHHMCTVVTNEEAVFRV
jgi:hypothetical protein